ncbi:MULTISPECIES: SDR family oxidoreductase [unclassified Mesorhizobium]|uniref:SDR family oxidoreductase n=1 Tax=unclassified Mesorhizobium TaxID=325217 RepID=UPI0003CF2C1A|nr:MULTISPECIES: SDR family oxidoreductase [unclassified Mesorhizobium]ESW87873.1 nucleoside-diphosphate sugar epimerase [Mesorhizobium sp. LSJC285A00]ESY10477.1 nucleoside-diphosphate sugar epimerase [Mesorhizobium sp. LNJC398B00]ESY32501.1 nucleoside-diphosphate sugar epimerase [Mesorhizobium sp. LNJC391B00]ESY36104.1 nucleoside-diphosphate sugar epimerase [Mesorhizobium sp. LNJC386A00]
MTATLLVTGASGQLGRGVINHLLDTLKVPANRIIATTRTPANLADLAVRGVVVRAADFNDPQSLAEAFAGADRALVISTNELEVQGKRREQQLAAVTAAKQAGVGHLLYTSMPNPEPGSPVVFAPDHYDTEQAIKASGIPYTIFRNGWYNENLFMALPQVLASGQWYTSAGDGAISYGTRDDFAAAIAAGLASDSSESATYTLTGPSAYTAAEVAALVTEVTSKPIKVIQLSDEALTEGMKSAGLPEPFAKVLVSFDAAARAGDLGMVTDAVEKLSGRKSVPLKQFLETNKAALAG